MKTLRLLILFLIISVNAIGQATPDWTRVHDAAADTAQLIPCKSIYDNYGNLIVVSSYYKSSPSGVTARIHIYKYDLGGNVLWSDVYDHNGTSQPRAFDVTVDQMDNIYIAGGLVGLQNPQPLVIKYDSTGAFQWEIDSFNNITTGVFRNIAFHNSKVFVSGDGLAVCMDNGTAIWSNPIICTDMIVDATDRIIVTSFPQPTSTLFRFLSNGAIDLSIATIPRAKVTMDTNNNIYLLSEIPNYELVKFNSSGVFQWNVTAFPAAPPFGDIGYDVVTDGSGNVYAVGLQDSMFKFDPTGALIWSRSLNGLDDYITKAQIYSTDLLFVGGSFSTLGGFDQGVAAYNSNGVRVWFGTHNSNNQQEFVVDMAVGVAGVFLLGDSVSGTILTKFTSPFITHVDYGFVCVDSIWYDPNNPNIINVTIYNGNVGQMNYPSVQIVSQEGDTIGNPGNFVNYFAQLGNGSQTYTDTILVAGITNWSNYTFVMNEGFGDTSAVIELCAVTKITGTEESVFETASVFPNPVENMINLTGLKAGNYLAVLRNQLGQSVRSLTASMTEEFQMPVNDLSSGIYFLTILSGKAAKTFKVVVQ